MALGFRLLPQAPPIAGNPANNYDFPNPKGRQSAITNYTWTQGPQPVPPILEVRAPFTTPYRVPYRTPDLYTWINTAKQLQPNPPMRQMDFPNPQAPRRATDLLTHININTIRTVPIVPPIRQYDFPNPRGAARLQDYTWLQGLAVQPVFPPISQKDWPNPKGPRPTDYTFLESILPFMQVPINRNDWVNPQLRKPFDYSYINDSLPLPLNVPPSFISQSDWPNPRGYPRLVDYTFLNVNTINTQVVNPPVTQRDFPNPQLRKPLDYTWLGLPIPVPPVAFNGQAGAITISNPRGRPPLNTGFTDYLSFLPLGIPITPLDWPNPKGPQKFDYLNIHDVDWIITDVIPPPSNYDWPNPRAALKPWQPTVYRPDVPPVAAVQNPFNPVDFPNPQTKRSNDLLSWLATPFFGVPGTPFKQTDWPNPQIRYSNDLKSWIATPFFGIAAAPFNQTDWPNPRGYLRSVDSLTWIQTTLPNGQTIIFPFNLDDWQNPRGYARANSLLYNQDFANLPVLAPGPNPPVRQYDWPNPRAALYPSDLRTFTDNTYILPIPPPVVVIPSQNFRQPGFGPGTMGMMGGFHN